MAKSDEFKEIIEDIVKILDEQNKMIKKLNTEIIDTNKRINRLESRR